MSDATGRERMDQLEKGLLDLYSRAGMDGDDKAVLLDAANRVAWDDAIHIASPWESRSSLCGNWFRNLVTLGEPRPDSVAGCWTCLTAAKWLDQHAVKGRQELRSDFQPGDAMVYGVPGATVLDLIYEARKDGRLR